MAVAGIAITSLGVTAAEPPPPAAPAAPLLISARSLGSVGGRIDGGDFAVALEGFGISSRPLPGAVPPDWRTPPAPMEPQPWISVVTAGFGGTAGPDDRAEAYAFLFDEPGGPLKRLGHVSYQQTYDSNATSWNWIPPTHRLAGAVRAAFVHAPAPDRPLLGIRMEAGKGTSGGSPVGAGLLPPGEDYLESSLHAAGRPVLEAMAWAAAFEAGWAPSLKTGPADASAVLEIRFGHKACSFRLTLKTAAGEQVSVKREVPENRYHAHLRRMFLALHPKAFFSDFLSLQERPAADLFTTGPGPLPRQDGNLLLDFSRDSETLVAVDADTGRQRWRQPLGDVLVCPPAPTPAGLLLATKSNRVLLLDPETGVVRAERRLPGWIGDVRWVDRPGGNADGAVACMCRNGGFYILNPADLAIRSMHELGAKAGGPMLIAEAFPVIWPGPSDPEDITVQMDRDRETRKPCLLVSDEEGFAYIVPLHKLWE